MCVCVCVHARWCAHVCLCVSENMYVCIWCMCSLYAPAASQHSPVLQESLLVRITHPQPLHHHCTPSVYFLITVMPIILNTARVGPYQAGPSNSGTQAWASVLAWYAGHSVSGQRHHLVPVSLSLPPMTYGHTPRR